MKFLYTLENEKGEAMSAYSPYTTSKGAMKAARDFYAPHTCFQGWWLFVKKWTQDDYGLPKDYVETIYTKDLSGYYRWLRLAIFDPQSKELTRGYRISNYVKKQIEDYSNIYDFHIEKMSDLQRKKFLYGIITKGLEDEE